MNKFLDYNFYLNTTNFDDFISKIKNYYKIPRFIEDDCDPILGEKWKTFPETEGYDTFFQYSYNSCGFRDSEIEFEADICYFGCSMTYGLGVPLEARFSNIVDKEFNFKSNNFAISGISSEETLKLFIKFNQFVKMKRAVFLFPDIYRYCLPIQLSTETEYGYFNMHPEFRDIYNQPEVLQIAKHFYHLPDSFFIDKFRICLHTIIEFARINNIELFLSTWAEGHQSLIEDLDHDNVSILNPLVLDSRARDCFIKPVGHAGIIPHKNFALDLIEKIKNKN